MSCVRCLRSSNVNIKWYLQHERQDDKSKAFIFSSPPFSGASEHHRISSHTAASHRSSEWFTKWLKLGCFTAHAIKTYDYCQLKPHNAKEKIEEKSYKKFVVSCEKRGKIFFQLAKAERKELLHVFGAANCLYDCYANYAVINQICNGNSASTRRRAFVFVRARTCKLMWRSLSLSLSLSLSMSTVCRLTKCAQK